MSEDDVDELIRRRREQTPLFPGSRRDALAGHFVSSPVIAAPGEDVKPEALPEPSPRPPAPVNTTRRQHHFEPPAPAGLPPRGKGRSYDVEEIRREHPRAYTAWTPEEEKRLEAAFRAGKTTAEIARELGREPGGIRSRLRRLGLT